MISAGIFSSIIQKVLPATTAKIEGYFTASATVENCVLSIISEIKIT